MKTPPTHEEIEAARTPAGGWKRKQLELWGVPWGVRRKGRLDEQKTLLPQSDHWPHHSPVVSFRGKLNIWICPHLSHFRTPIR